MPAASLRDRRVNSRARTAASSDRGRTRAARTPAPGASKLRAARSAGLSVPAILGALALLAVLLVAAALATGGRARQLYAIGDRIALGGQRIAADVRARLDHGGTALAGLNFSVPADLGFSVGAVHLQGATHDAQDEILKAATVRQGSPLLGLDLGAIRARVERVGWVDHARIIRLFPDTVVIAVTQRPLMAIWQVAGHRYVVAADGRPVTAVDPLQFQTLPLIIGPGANTAASAFLPVLAAEPLLSGKVEGARRVDGRRWDVLLKGGEVILLPESGEAAALQRLERLDRGGRILSLGLARIDLRSSDFTVVRPAAAAPVSGGTSSHGV